MGSDSEGSDSILFTSPSLSWKPEIISPIPKMVMATPNMILKKRRLRKE
jgi:hypothetical protein